MLNVLSAFVKLRSGEDESLQKVKHGAILIPNGVLEEVKRPIGEEWRKVFPTVACRWENLSTVGIVYN